MTGKIPELYLYSPEREQITRNDLAFSEQALQMGLDSSPEMATLGTEIGDDSVQTFGIHVLRMSHIPSQ